MKQMLRGWALGLFLVAAGFNSAAAQSTDISECRDEAVSTGLEDETAIQAYIDQCMQRFAGMEGYQYETATQENPEQTAEDSAAEYQQVN